MATPQEQQDQASRERATVNVKISVAVLKLHLLGVAGNPDGKRASSMDDFLGDIGAETAKYLPSLALVLQNLGTLGKRIIDFPKPGERR